MPDVTAEAIGSSLDERMDRGEAPWLPGLAACLAHPFRNNTDPSAWAAYTTANQLGMACPASNRLAMIDLGASAPALLERLPPVLQHAFPSLRFVAEPSTFLARAEIGRAVELLSPAFLAREAVGQLVRAIHVIIPRAVGYDCSHSEPTLPFSILVSIPIGEQNAAMRLAESILHEAMHLQLSLIEREVALALDDCAEYYSPWQRRMRPMAGLVHGLYVHACILGWLDMLREEPILTSADRHYLERRRATIVKEIGQTAGLSALPGLTPLGRRLSRWLLRGSPRAVAG